MEAFMLKEEQIDTTYIFYITNNLTNLTNV